MKLGSVRKEIDIAPEKEEEKGEPDQNHEFEQALLSPDEGRVLEEEDEIPSTTVPEIEVLAGDNKAPTVPSSTKNQSAEKLYGLNIDGEKATEDQNKSDHEEVKSVVEPYTSFRKNDCLRVIEETIGGPIQNTLMEQFLDKD